MGNLQKLSSLDYIYTYICITLRNLSTGGFTCSIRHSIDFINFLSNRCSLSAEISNAWNSSTSTGRHNRHRNENLIYALCNPFACTYHEGIGPLDLNDCYALRFIVPNMSEVHFMVLSYRARSVLCCVITQLVVVISYRRVGATYRSLHQDSRIQDSAIFIYFSAGAWNHASDRALDMAE